jgi:hypothetical protein
MTAETLIYSSYRENTVFLNALWICLAILAIAYSTVRYLKLTRRLRIPATPAAPVA